MTGGGGPDVPAQYQADVSDAASALGIPESVVAAQISLESGFNPAAVSPAGAEGIAQFEPGTFADYGSGSPFNVSDAFAAYTKYMGALLKQEGGSIDKALEAYNAGPGDLAAGAGYANTILSNAGVSSTADAGKAAVGTPTGTSSSSSSSGGLISWPSDIIKFFSEGYDTLADTAELVGVLRQPSTWVRGGAGLFGLVFVVLGIVCLALEIKDR